MDTKGITGEQLEMGDISKFKGLVGTLGWPVINTRPDGAFDTSWLSSVSANARKCDVHLGNKVVKRLQNNPLHLKYKKISKSVNDWRVVTSHDAGLSVRPSLHSQAGGLHFIADKRILDKQPAPANLMDWLCIKIDSACKSSFECEIISGNLNLDGARLVRAGWSPT